MHGLSPPGRGLASRITGLTLAILIYIIILTYGIMITIGVGEEKATRVVEVLLTTLRPVQLLAGKVIGMGLLALAQIAAMVGLYLALGHAVGSAQVRGARDPAHGRQAQGAPGTQVGGLAHNRVSRL